MRWLLIAMLIGVSVSARAEGLSKAEAAVLVAAEVSLAMDMLQTLQIRRLNDATARDLNCNPCSEINLRREMNPILGPHPSDAAVLSYFATAMAATAATTYLLPGKLRWLAPVLVLAVEIPQIGHNFSVGTGLRLPF